MIRPVWPGTALLSLLLLPGCVAIGPTIPVAPGPGATQAAFEGDRRACTMHTDQQVQPVANRSAASTLLGARQDAATPAAIQLLYDATFAQCMAERGHLVLQAAMSTPRQPASTLSTASASCGLRGVDLPIGMPVQQMVIGAREQPTIGFGQARTVVTRAAVLAPPCHGSLTSTRPVSFRYAPQRGYRGTDTFAIRACNAAGECSITAFAVMIGS